MTHLCERLSEAGQEVALMGCGSDCFPLRAGKGEIRICTTLSAVSEGADVLVLPLPATRDGETVHCPRDSACRVTLREVAELLNRTPRALLFGGRLPPELLSLVEEPHPETPRVTDYYESKALQLNNAYMTAEAALMTAMELTDRALRYTSAAVLGFGRIGKYLARLLRALGADVTVCARRQEALLEAAAEGCRTLLMNEADSMGGLSPLCRNHTVLFNTIPAPVLSRELLMGLERDTLLIDLASAPFGVRDGDVREATAHGGLRYLRAPSLPGSYAPRDAGYIIADCILDTVARRDALRLAEGEGGTSP
jgi:dipicolinate synthase subunit A